VTQVSVFEANGTLARRFPATGAPRILSRWAAVTPLPKGRFVVAWTEENVDNPAAGTNIGARVCSAQGVLGKAIAVNTVTGGNRFSLSVSATTGPSGDLAFFAWNDDVRTTPNQSGHAVKGRLLDVPANGF